MSLIVEAKYENGVLRPIAPLLGLEEGARVIVTVREKREIDEREEELYRMMDEDGLICHFPPPDEPPPANFTPIEIIGKPLSETIIEERR
jgi:predicted DNA-binding antitoxin AbrB/MazE fold protein